MNPTNLTLLMLIVSFTSNGRIFDRRLCFGILLHRNSNLVQNLSPTIIEPSYDSIVICLLFTYYPRYLDRRRTTPDRLQV